jgi:hypothetical protein
MLWLRLQLPWLLAREPLDELLARLGGPAAGVRVALPELEHLVDRGEAWADRVPLLPRTCLYRSLARFALFRRHGFPVAFVMGISPRGPEEDGHAWLEFDGTPYREDRAAEFVETFRYPSGAFDIAR